MREVRHLPLRKLATPGVFGSITHEPGITLSIVHPLVLASVIARAGQGSAVAQDLKGLREADAMWAGPDQYFVEGVSAKALKEQLGSSASVIDQSHGRVGIVIAGSQSRSVLSKGTPVDLHPASFPIGKAAMTQMAHVSVHLARTGEDAFKLLVFRGFAESFWDWLIKSSAQYGYRVT
jgi:methylglutamate dehydrogenase subunit D